MQEIDDLQRAQIIEDGMASLFWKEVLEPLLSQRRHAMTAALRNPSLTRKHEVPDDYIRGQLELADLVLDQPKLLAESIRQAAVEEKLAEERENEYIEIAHKGWGVGPTSE